MQEIIEIIKIKQNKIFTNFSPVKLLYWHYNNYTKNNLIWLFKG